MKTLVAEIVRKYQTNNPFELANKLGIIVLFDQLGDIAAFCTKAYGKKIIQINSDFPKHRSEHLLASCLYFAIVGKENEISLKRIKTKGIECTEDEWKADLFAILFLDTKKNVLKYRSIDEMFEKMNLSEKDKQDFCEWLDGILSKEKRIKKITNCHRINQVLHIIEDRMRENVFR